MHLSASDNEIENNALASTFGPVESVDTLDGAISVSEVQAAIKVLKDPKAAGPDGLSSDYYFFLQIFSPLCFTFLDRILQ